jgi:NAD+ synthase
MMKTDKIIEHIVQWLRDYLDQSGLQGFTVGVSGGIDSAVSSTLCALTGKRLIALNMPIYQAKDQLSRASQHISRLEEQFFNVKGLDIELTPIFEQMETSFPSDIQDGLTMANTRSRLRMLTLYAVASHHKLLVVGTGNKVEDFGIGFFTKYGDGGVDISPIADLMKSEVYALGKELGIQEEILKAPPTDGLWEDNRNDEEQIGASYAELEWAMQYIASGETGKLTEQKQKVLKRFKQLNAANQHKIKPIPVCLIPDELRV